ncbi:hypothetical protein LSAT2_024442, partial [Lamellibrachia satsuma]
MATCGKAAARAVCACEGGIIRWIPRASQLEFRGMPGEVRLDVVAPTVDTAKHNGLSRTLLKNKSL